MSITIHNSQVREVINQVVNDPDYKKVSKVPFLSAYQTGLLLLAYGGFALGIASYFYLNASLWLVVPIMGFCSYLAFTPLHDSTHQAASSNKFLNDALGTLAAFLLFPFMLASVYRFLHMTHHRYVGDDDLDPDSILVAIPTRYYPWGYLILLVFDIAWIYWLFTKGWSRMPSKVRMATYFSVIGFLAFNIIWFASPYWFEYLMLFYIPTRIGQAYTAYTFAHIQHPDGVKWDEFPFESTYVMKERKHFLLRSLLGQEQHAMHHFLPHVPWYKYKDVWKLGNGIFTKQQIPERSIASKPDFDFKEHLQQKKSQERNFTKVKLADVRDAATDIKSFIFESGERTKLPAFTAGSHLDIKLPSGKVRSYSLINAQHEENRYQIAVKKEAEGKGGSKEMHELQPGTVLEVSMPKNNFVLYENVQRYILISGGIGITPLLSMAHRLDELDKHFELHICAKTKEEIPFQYELQNWSFAPNIEFHLDRGGNASIDLRKVLNQPNENTLVYCCGPLGFNKWIKETALMIGWDSNQIKQELFTVDTNKTAKPNAFDVVLKKTGKTIHVPKDRSMVDMLELEKVAVKYACLQGTCGTCVTEVLAGKVDHRDAVLTEEEKLENNKMCLCVSRANGKSITLDL